MSARARPLGTSGRPFRITRSVRWSVARSKLRYGCTVSAWVLSVPCLKTASTLRSLSASPPLTKATRNRSAVW